MDNPKNTIGQRVRELRKRKGLNQQELANLLNKSLRTIQKYENGEISISVAMVNQLAQVLDTTSTYILGYEHEGAKIECLSDVMDFLFCLEKIAGMKLTIDVKRPPHFDGWECSLNFNGKDMSAELNSTMCLFLEDWKNISEEFHSYAIDKAKYDQWKDQTLAYYAAQSVELQEPPALDSDIRMAKRKEFLEALYQTPDTSQN